MSPQTVGMRPLLRQHSELWRRHLGCNVSKLSLQLLSVWMMVQIASIVFGYCCQWCIGSLAFDHGLPMLRYAISFILPCEDCAMRFRSHHALLSLLCDLFSAQGRHWPAGARQHMFVISLPNLLDKTHCTSRSSSCTSPMRKPWVPSIPGHHTGHTRELLGRCRRLAPVWASASAWEQAWWTGCPGWGWTRRCRCPSTSAPRVRGSGTGARC